MNKYVKGEIGFRESMPLRYRFSVHGPLVSNKDFLFERGIDVNTVKRGYVSMKLLKSTI